jgi:hypothetical protein
VRSHRDALLDDLRAHLPAEAGPRRPCDAPV